MSEHNEPFPPPSPELPDTSSFDDRELYESEPPLAVQYDPSKVGTLTARQMSDIESHLNLMSSSVAEGSPEEAQAYVDGILESMGIDPGLARDGVIMVNFVDVDGSIELRPIVITADDFGTFKLNVEPVPVEAQEQSNPEEEVAQEHAKKQLAEQVVGETRALRMSLEQSEVDGHSRDRAMDEFISSVRSEQHRLFADQSFARRFGEEWTGELIGRMNREIEVAEQDLQRVRKYDALLSETNATAVNVLSEGKREEFAVSMRQVDMVCSELKDNRTQNRTAVEEARQLAGRALRILNDEIPYSQTGHDELRGYLVHTMTQLESVFERHKYLKGSLPMLMNGLEQAANRLQ